MTNEQILIIIKIGIFITMFICCALFFILLKDIGKATGNLGDLAQKEIENALKKKGNLSKQQLKLSKLGIMYHMRSYDLNPAVYILLKMMLGILVSLLIGLLFDNFTFAFIGLPIGYIGTDLLFKYSNILDNKAILMDLYNTYANLKIQMDAGMYIIDSLEYAQKLAQNRRYKEALGELIINFSDKTISMSDAIMIFKHRFDSREIDKLCALLQNCMEYGAQAAYTKDIMGEIQSILLASTIESENKISSKVGLVNFAFFAMIIFLTAYSVLINFSGLDIFL